MSYPNFIIVCPTLITNYTLPSFFTENSIVFTNLREGWGEHIAVDIQGKQAINFDTGTLEEYYIYDDENRIQQFFISEVVSIIHVDIIHKRIKIGPTIRLIASAFRGFVDFDRQITDSILRGDDPGDLNRFLNRLW